MQVSAFAQPLPPALQQQFSEVQSPSLSAPQNAVDAAPFAVATVYPHTAVPIAEHHHHHHDSLASNRKSARHIKLLFIGTPYARPYAHTGAH